MQRILITLLDDWGRGEAITGCQLNWVLCLPTNCDTNTGVVGRFGVISSDYHSLLITDTEGTCLSSLVCENSLQTKKWYLMLPS